jgi:hypothetical protein
VYAFAETFNRRVAASAEAIARAARSLGLQLPHDYECFLRFANGGEGFIGDHYAILWSAEELAQLNRDYEVQRYAPGLLIFGTNGGGEAFAFDTRRFPWAVVQVPFIVMELDAAEPLAPSFEAFLTFLQETK